jgi:hypothetical protein
MRRVKVLINFLQFTIAVRIIFYRSVIANLLGNVNFLEPTVSLDEATTAVDALEVATVAAQDGSHINIALRNDAEKVADEVFRKLANFVDDNSMGDETKIISSGFSPSNQPSPIFKAILSVVNALHSGCVKLITIKGFNTHAYIWRYRLATVNGVESPWIYLTTTTQTSYEVAGLVPGIEYEFQVAGVTPEGVTEYCQPVRKLVV